MNHLAHFATVDVMRVQRKLPRGKGAQGFSLNRPARPPYLCSLASCPPLLSSEPISPVPALPRSYGSSPLAGQPGAATNRPNRKQSTLARTIVARPLERLARGKRSTARYAARRAGRAALPPSRPCCLPSASARPAAVRSGRAGFSPAVPSRPMAGAERSRGALVRGLRAPTCVTKSVLTSRAPFSPAQRGRCVGRRRGWRRTLWRAAINAGGRH